MQWVKITSEADLPKKPGERSYEQIDCLIWHKGEPKFSVWNCEHRVWDDVHRVWDDVHGDDYFYDPLEPSHYAVIEAPEDSQ